MRKKNYTKTILVKVDDRLEERLDEMAEANYSDRSKTIRRLIDQEYERFIKEKEKENKAKG